MTVAAPSPGVANEESPASVPEPGMLARWRRLPAAARWAMLARYLNDSATSIMLGALFDGYLNIGRGYTFIGDVESARGCATMLLALPIGILSDRVGKSLVLRRNVLLGLVSATLLAVGLGFNFLAVVIVGCVLMSIHDQVSLSLLPVLLTEVTSTGEERTRAMGNLSTSSSLGRASGPALQLLVLVITGTDEWTLNVRYALLLGLFWFAAYVPTILHVMRLHDQTMSDQAEAQRALTQSPETPGTPNSPLQEQPASRWNITVAFLCETSSLITAFGSGMTFKFWPLFFKNDYNFSPSAVCAITLGTWLAIAWGSSLSPLLAERLGNLPAANVLHILATVGLYYIALTPDMWVGFVVPLVLLRNSLMNSGIPLTRSFILGLVPAKHRGKWSSVDSIRRMTWSGSAFIGGRLSDGHDPRYAFFITACVHTGSGFLLLFVNYLIWRRPVDTEARCVRT